MTGQKKRRTRIKVELDKVYPAGKDVMEFVPHYDRVRCIIWDGDKAKGMITDILEAKPHIIEELVDDRYGILVSFGNLKEKQCN